MKNKLTNLQSVADVHKNLTLAGIKSATGQGSNFITNAKACGYFPSIYANVMRVEAKRRGFLIDDSVFNFVQAKESAR
tara:strand:+ start:2170 stop:2403 length:234 start_codon:yes stop_codon:yes gene_type:complete